MKLIQMEKPLEYADHAFGTALGSQAPTDPEELIRGYSETLGGIAHMRQVHGDRIVYANAPGLYEEADAIFTDQRNLWLAVKTADCVPVLISSPHAVAAVHCGWRGLQADILPKTLTLLMDEFNMTGIDLFIHIGPCITQEHYEVSTSYKTFFADKHFKPSKTPGKVLLNLASVVEEQAQCCGVPKDHIHNSGLCTFSEKDLLHSHRRNKSQGVDTYQVQLSLVSLLYEADDMLV